MVLSIDECSCKDSLDSERKAVAVNAQERSHQLQVFWHESLGDVMADRQTDMHDYKAHTEPDARRSQSGRAETDKKKN
jgi:hypothetical protein